jgi:hypothetical protein
VLYHKRAPPIQSGRVHPWALIPTNRSRAPSEAARAASAVDVCRLCAGGHRARIPHPFKGPSHQVLLPPADGIGAALSLGACVARLINWKMEHDGPFASGPRLSARRPADRLAYAAETPPAAARRHRGPVRTAAVPTSELSSLIATAGATSGCRTRRWASALPSPVARRLAASVPCLATPAIKARSSSTARTVAARHSFRNRTYATWRASKP